MIKLQIIEDNKGKAAGVFIPINDWENLKRKYKILNELEYKEPTKEELIQELRDAVIELKLIESGKLKARAATELINEL